MLLNSMANTPVSPPANTDMKDIDDDNKLETVVSNGAPRATQGSDSNPALALYASSGHLYVKTLVATSKLC